MTNVSEETKREAARHNLGATIAWGDGAAYDLLNPNPEIMTISDYAYGLAYTVRFRGQTWVREQRVFYGVCEHNVRGAEALWIEQLNDGPPALAAMHALAFLYHESGELPLGDLPGPAKSLFPGWRELETKHCAAINARFDVATPDPDLIKRMDVRMYLTEKRDLKPGGLGDAKITPGFEPLAGVIIPFAHPDMAAERFLRMNRVLRDVIARADG